MGLGCGACTVGLFEYLSTLMLICAQSGRVSGLEKKTDPTSSARSDKKGLKKNKNQLLGIVKKFCIPFGTKSKISICGGLDSDCIVVTLQRIANFLVKHLNSGFEQTRRGFILLVLLFIQPVLILLYRFSVKNTASRPVFRVKSEIGLNVFDLVDSSIPKGPNSIFLANFFSWNLLD